MSNLYSTEKERYQALVDRDERAVGHFVYLVKTTKIYCRPTCSARLANRNNIRYASCSTEAEAMGFRPCKRCHPHLAELWNPMAEMVKKACVSIWCQASQRQPLDINSLLNEVEYSKWHFYRTFKNYTGTTPKRFYTTCFRDPGNPLNLGPPVPAITTKKGIQRRKAQKTLLPPIINLG